MRRRNGAAALGSVRPLWSMKIMQRAFESISSFLPRTAYRVMQTSSRLWVRGALSAVMLNVGEVPHKQRYQVVPQRYLDIFGLAL